MLFLFIYLYNYKVNVAGTSKNSLFEHENLKILYFLNLITSLQFS